MSKQGPIEFGEYHLLEKIATGGMAEVWRARAYGMAGFEKILVIKKVLANLAQDDEFIRLFIDEARIAVQLVHVNIVQVFDLDHVDGHYYMAMEYVHGMDLARILSRSRSVGPLPISVCLFVASEVLKALSFAHERRDEAGNPMNIVHCDISPQNTLISYSGEVKITDFGISRATFQATTLQQTIRGKYAYMSPEQLGGSKLDARSDLFSLGIVLFEMLTGRRLFKSKSRKETLERVRRAEVPSPRSYRPEISEDLEAFLFKALSRERSERFSSGREMLNELSALMVREGHRASNLDLANYVRDVIETASDSSRASKLRVAPNSVVVLALEATPPPRSLASPKVSLATLTQEWGGLIADADGEIWERDDGSMLVVWVSAAGVKTDLPKAVKTAVTLRKTTQRAGYRLAAGVAPGVARMNPDARRPPEGWELSGPFYLARWMMNLSAHRGRVLLTEVGSKQVESERASPLGRISIQGNRYINLYEIA